MSAPAQTTSPPGRRAHTHVERTMAAVALHGAWLLCSLPVVTWLCSSVAMVHSLDRWITYGDDRLVQNFRRGWLRHWRHTVPVGTASALVFAVLLANLLFLMTRDSEAAVVLLIGTLGLMLIWAMLNLSLVTVIALFPGLPARRCVRESFVLAFRRPLSLISVVVGSLVASAVLYQLFMPLVVLSAGLAGFLGLRFCYRGLEGPDRPSPVSPS